MNGFGLEADSYWGHEHLKKPEVLGEKASFGPLHFSTRLSS
jgi:hypothetical protein